MSSWAAGAGLLAALLLVVFFLIWIALRAWRRLGETRKELRDAEKTISQARRAREIDEKVSDMSDDELNDRLRGDS